MLSIRIKFMVKFYTTKDSSEPRLGLGSFHSFPPSMPLAFPTFSQLLKKARCRQDNHHLIRGYIESRLSVIYYKLGRCVHTHTKIHRQQNAYEHITGAGVIMVHNDKLQKEAITHTHMDKHVYEKKSKPIYPQQTWMPLHSSECKAPPPTTPSSYSREMLALGKSIDKF